MQLPVELICEVSLLFRHMDATTADGGAGLLQISTSPLAGFVRQVDFGICDPWSDISRPEIPKYAEDMAGLLSSCLARFPNLTALGFIDSSWDRRIQKPFLNSLRMTLLDLDLPELQELHINYPFAYDLGRLLHDETRTPRRPIVQVFRRLRHLGIHLTVYKGQVGRLSGPEMARHGVPSNKPYSGNVIGLAALAENLQSLDIGTVEGLDMDGLAVPRSWHLRSLKLQEVNLSSGTLLKLIGGSRDTIESVRLWMVRLKSSTWEQVLQAIALIEPPRLFNFDMGFCLYPEDGTSSALATSAKRPWEPDDLPPIRTARPGDLEALGRLQFQVNATRAAAGRPMFDEDQYPYAHRHAAELQDEKERRHFSRDE